MVADYLEVKPLKIIAWRAERRQLIHTVQFSTQMNDLRFSVRQV